MAGTTQVEGTIEDVFGHRFTLKTDSGKILVDLGPEAGDASEVTAGARVAVKGEQKPNEFKARSLQAGSGEWRELKMGDKKDGKDHDEKPVDISDAEVAQALKAGGYGEGSDHVRKHKHVEVVAEKDGVKHKVHVHKGGEIKKAEPIA